MDPEERPPAEGGGKAPRPEGEAWRLEREELLTRLEVERHARRLGLVDEEAAWRLLDAAAVERDAAGRPTNVEALLREMARARPWLAAAEPPGGGVSAANPAGGRGVRLSRDEIRRMTPEQINANWAAVQAALQSE
ncbi:MAG: hypothetical protein IT208_00985 [Chthonomonadales bacterium]|nr:hypothetical protein [Chthonomonadales bacterium]